MYKFESMWFKMIITILTVSMAYVSCIVNRYKLTSTNTLYNRDVITTLTSKSMSSSYCGSQCLLLRCKSFLYRGSDYFCRLYSEENPNSEGAESFPGSVLYTIVTHTLQVSYGGIWGNWFDKKSFCPVGTHANGYKVKMHAAQGSGDDTGLNNVALICNSKDEPSDVIVSEEPNSASYGTWIGPVRCANTGDYLSTFAMRVLINQGIGDDSAVNAVKFKCRPFNGKTSVTLDTSVEFNGPFGVWGIWSDECPIQSAICGLHIKYEKWTYDGDETAVNDIQFFCCY